jgi:hypothetical protein
MLKGTGAEPINGLSGLTDEYILYQAGFQCVKVWCIIVAVLLLLALHYLLTSMW